MCNMLFRCASFAAVLTVCLASIAPAQCAAEQPRLTALVARVTDGDTFRLTDVARAIRVWGLDAPERKEPAGPARTAAMRTLITDQTLTCEIKDIDRYDRLVGQCFLPDGRDIAAEMIRMGVATEYCRYSGGYYGTC